MTDLVTTMAPPEVAGADGGVVHVCCVCSFDLAFCGADLTGKAEVPRRTRRYPRCVVCDDLDRLPCERCNQ